MRTGVARGSSVGRGDATTDADGKGAGETLASATGGAVDAAATGRELGRALDAGRADTPASTPKASPPRIATTATPTRATRFIAGASGSRARGLFLVRPSLSTSSCFG